jgi:hypothetical protein
LFVPFNEIVEDYTTTSRYYKSRGEYTMSTKPLKITALDPIGEPCCKGSSFLITPEDSKLRLALIKFQDGPQAVGINGVTEEVLLRLVKQKIERLGKRNPKIKLACYHLEQAILNLE